MKKIVFLASGNGGNLKFLFYAQKKGIVANMQLVVVADRECGSLIFAKNNGLENYLIYYKKTDTKELLSLLGKLQPDMVVTNWSKVIDEETVRCYEGRMINLHYSLLPAFGGLIGIEPIRCAYRRGCQYIGPTCHLIDEGVDTGRIVAQAIFRTDISLDDAIGVMFRKGCLVLLNGIQRVVGERFVNDISVEDAPLFSPSLGFSENLFSDEFWQELAVA